MPKHRRPRSAGRRRKTLAVLLAAAVALLVALVCGGLLLGAGDRARPQESPMPADQAPAPTPMDRPGAGPRTATGTPQDPRPAPTSAGSGAQPLPADLNITQVGGVWLPTSASAGPHHSGDGLASGFARDLPGAALAAVHILVRIHPELGADVFGPTLSNQVTGPYVAALRDKVHQASGELLNRWPVPYGQPAGTLHLAMAGFTVKSFTPDEATVRLLFEVPEQDGTLLGATTVQMMWQRDDWALIAPVDGVFATTTLVEDE